MATAYSRRATRMRPMRGFRAGLLRWILPVLAGAAVTIGLHAAVGAAGSVQGKKMEKKPANSSPSVLRDVQYGLSGGVRLLMNITIPDPAPCRPVPAIVFLHGGGWSGGSREDMMSRSALAARHGYVAASVEYRLSGSDARFSAAGSAPFPAQLQDCKCAVRYLRANARKYGIDASRIAVWGCSAGGHLAAMMGLTANIAEFEGDGGNPLTSSDVQLVVDCFGPTDFVAWEQEVNKWAQDKEARRLFAPPPADQGMIDWWTNFGLERDPGVVKLFDGKARERSAWASPMTYADRSRSLEALSKAQNWQDQDAYRQSIGRPESRWALIDLGDGASWERSESSTTGLRLTSQAGGVTGKCLAYEAQSVDGWGAFMKKLPKGLIRPEHNAVALWAKGDDSTPELMVELDEEDGSRWMHTLKITAEWKYYEVPFSAFVNLPDPQVKAMRGGRGDGLNGRSAARVSIALARMLTELPAGPHHLWIDGLGTTRSKLAEPARFLIVHGTLDTWVPIQQSLRLADALAKSGTDVTLLIKADMGHDESKALPEVMEHVKRILPIE